MDTFKPKTPTEALQLLLENVGSDCNSGFEDHANYVVAAALLGKAIEMPDDEISQLTVKFFL
jgi:hypothetical protein